MEAAENENLHFLEFEFKSLENMNTTNSKKMK